VLPSVPRHNVEYGASLEALQTPFGTPFQNSLQRSSKCSTLFPIQNPLEGVIDPWSPNPSKVFLGDRAVSLTRSSPSMCANRLAKHSWGRHCLRSMISQQRNVEGPAFLLIIDKSKRLTRCDGVYLIAKNPNSAPYVARTDVTNTCRHKTWQSESP
jgi:hypothetical protein